MQKGTKLKLVGFPEDVDPPINVREALELVTEFDGLIIFRSPSGDKEVVISRDGDTVATHLVLWRHYPEDGPYPYTGTLNGADEAVHEIATEWLKEV